MKEKEQAREQLISELSLANQEISKLLNTEAEYKKSVQALRKSEVFFRAITQNSSDIIIIVNKTGKILFANPSIERFLGYQPDDLIGKSAFDYIVRSDIPRAIYDFGKALMTKDTVIPNSFGVLHKDG